MRGSRTIGGEGGDARTVGGISWGALCWYRVAVADTFQRRFKHQQQLRQQSAQCSVLAECGACAAVISMLGLSAQRRSLCVSRSIASPAWLSFISVRA